MDLPIKIVFNNGDYYSFLGLGDILIPGLLISLCLRYDLSV